MGEHPHGQMDTGLGPPCSPGCGSSCRGRNNASSLWGHHLLGWPTNLPSPAGSWGPGTPAGTLVPAALLIWGPPTAQQVAMPVSLGGGPSTVIETRFPTGLTDRVLPECHPERRQSLHVQEPCSGPSAPRAQHHLVSTRFPVLW